MTHPARIFACAALLAAVFCGAARAEDEAAEKKEKSAKKKDDAAKDGVLCPIQGFESADIFDKKEHVSHLSGVPEEAEVEIWSDAPLARRKIDIKEARIACAISKEHEREGKASLEAKFNSPDEWLRVSLRNNFDQSGPERAAANSLGFFDYLEGHIYNAEHEDVALDVRVVGGFALTDKSAWPALESALRLKPGWNRFRIDPAEAAAAFANPHDAAAVEFRVPRAAGQTLHFDHFHMAAAGLGKALAAHARCFDFGVRHFVFPGFTYGSEKYDAERGFGFTAGDKLTHGGDTHILDDALTRDGFDIPAAFRVDLPNGKYRVQVQSGNYWAHRDYASEMEILAEGKVAWRKPRLTPEESIHAKHYTEEKLDCDRPDYDLWGNYQQNLYFRDLVFDAEVEDGNLDLEWKVNTAGGRSIWTSLYVYPVARAEAVEADLRALRERLKNIYNRVSHPRYGRSFALYNREEAVAPDEMLWPSLAEARRAALKPGDAAQERGYVHFLRSSQDAITPYSVPRPDETGDGVRAFAAQGQTAFLNIGLFPLRDLDEKAVLRVYDLRQIGGKGRIGRENIDVRLVSYRCTTPVTDGHAENANLFAPGVLMHSDGVSLHKDYPRAFHIAVAVPPAAAEGVYSGEAEILLGGRRTSTLTVSLRVLPYKLAEPKDVKLAVGHGNVETFWERFFPGTLAERYPELEFYKRMGLNAVWFTGDAKNAETMQAWGKRYNLEIVPGTAPVWKFLWPEDCNGPELARQKEQGKTLSYQRGHEEGRRQRFTWGFWLWRSGIRLRVLPIQPNAAERVFYAHAGHQKFGPGAYLWPSGEGVGRFSFSPTVCEVADGIADYRFLSTLEEALVTPVSVPAPVAPRAPVAPGAEAAPAPPAEAPPIVLLPAADARTYLDALRAQIEPGLREYYFHRKRNFNHVGRWGMREGNWCGARFDAERWEIARRVAPGGLTQPQPPAPRAENLLALREEFGPRFPGDEAWWQESLGKPLSALPSRLVAETPKVLATRPFASLASYFDGKLAGGDWTLIVRSADGAEAARQAVGKVAAIKTRWLLNLGGLPEGKYTVTLTPAAGGAEAAATAEVVVIPGY